MSQFIHTDVTAVKSYRNLILTGIGSSISVFEKESFKLLTRIKCLEGQKIYGLVPLENSGKVLVFGGKQYTVIKLNEDSTHFERLFLPSTCDDWLHSAVWVDTDSAALLTAHNTIQIWNVTTQSMLSQHLSTDNSILYSGLLLPLLDGLVVFAGTVYSEVIIHTPQNVKPLHILKGHRGVIFSISCDPEKSVMVTTSDDRSVRIWQLIRTDCISLLSCNTMEYWKNINIVCSQEVYGHTARVMRSYITEDLIVSVGEDSAICFWNHRGKLLKKNESHKNCPIWSIDGDCSHIFTGGGDGAVIMHPLSMALDEGQQTTIHLNTQKAIVPKKIAITARNNLVILDDSDEVIYYYKANAMTSETHSVNIFSTLRFLSVSSCKQLFAVGDLSGKLDIFAEDCKHDSLRKIIQCNLKVGPILSMHWAGNRHLILCGEEGLLTVLTAVEPALKIHRLAFLPNCKDRRLTAAAMNSQNKIMVVGDRCGNVHVYVDERRNPVHTFKKVHGVYGPTSITVKPNEFITTGRDGTIRYFALDFSLNNDDSVAKFKSSKDVAFQWVERFIDKDENIICGFKEREFVVHNVQSNVKLIAIPCGGGHRTWDVVRNVIIIDKKTDELVKLVYAKNNVICSHTFQLSKVVSKHVINSSHSKEINCLKSFKNELDATVTYYVSGGEDTTLRVSSINSDMQICDEVVFKHLSNVRALKILDLDGSILVVSGGGRAQIRIQRIYVSRGHKRLKVAAQELTNYLIKGTDKGRKCNQSWKNNTIDFDPETRIMDVDLLKQEDDNFLVFAGCSDAHLRVFAFVNECDNATFEPVAELKHHQTCILKTTCIKILNKNILITCTTRGEVSLWDVSNIESWDGLSPFFTTTSNKCGINCIDTRVLCDSLLVATGGDDNAIHLTLMEFPNRNVYAACVKHAWSTDQFHCSQVTGVRFVEDLLLSTCIDQRVTLARWRVGEKAIVCEFQSQIFSDIADIQGIEVLSDTGNVIKVCVFGKGFEMLELPKP